MHNSFAVKRPLTLPTPPWAGKTLWTAASKKCHYRARNYNTEYRNSRSGKIEFAAWLSVNTGKSLNPMECLCSSLLRGSYMHLATTPLWRVAGTGNHWIEGWVDPRAGLLPPGLQCNRCTVHYLSNKTEDYVTVKAWGGVEFLCVCVCVCVCARACGSAVLCMQRSCSVHVSERQIELRWKNVNAKGRRGRRMTVSCVRKIAKSDYCLPHFCSYVLPHGTTRIQLDGFSLKNLIFQDF